MKKFILGIALGLAGIVSVSAQEFTFAEEFVNPDTNDVVIDYGTIENGADGQRTFVFTNTGAKPLVISRVQTSCGCTTPEYSKEPVLPGAEGKIVVKYDTKRTGPFQKSITVYSNAEEAGRKVLKIKGTIKS
ncbi:hypothetical protein UJ101_02187 [Flavobacteriaceae bacterium UJ101]|nr:hypothetical protein UJ101_02187 [Flavobacteriaceae bacterium UJ101]